MLKKKCWKDSYEDSFFSRFIWRLFFFQTKLNEADAKMIVFYLIGQWKLLICFSSNVSVNHLISSFEYIHLFISVWLNILVYLWIGIILFAVLQLCDLSTSTGSALYLGLSIWRGESTTMRTPSQHHYRVAPARPSPQRNRHRQNHPTATPAATLKLQW